MIQKIPKILFLFFGLMVAVSIYWFLHLSQSASGSLWQAQQRYHAAGGESYLIQRNRDLNQALDIYLNLEEQYQPRDGNGKLYHNIAQLFFDLEQYSWAAFYDYQAQRLRPRDPNIKESLQKTLDHLNLKLSSQDSIFRKVFFFHYQLSLPERLQILSLCIFIALVLGSLYLWREMHFLKGLIALILCLSLSFFISVAYTKYFEPMEGVVIKSSMLYRNVRKEPPFITEKPVQEGIKLEVLNVLKEGEWVKIRTEEGTVGYLPSSSIRLLS